MEVTGVSKDLEVVMAAVAMAAVAMDNKDSEVVMDNMVVVSVTEEEEEDTGKRMKKKLCIWKSLIKYFNFRQGGHGQGFGK